MATRLAVSALLAGALASACASAPTGVTDTAAVDAGIAGVPAAALGTQTLFQVQVDDQTGHNSLRLVLRLWTANRFELAASDSFGRALWRLVVHDDEGYWIEGRDREVCRLDPRSPLRWPRLALMVPAAELPALLLGRLPEPLLEGTRPVPASGVVVDRSGRSWEIVRDAAGLSTWSFGSGASRLQWRREAGGGRLELGAGEIRIGWRGGAREPAPGTAPALPAGSGAAPECRLEELS